MRLALLISLLSAAALLTACGADDDASGSADAEVRVVATTLQVADLVRNVGGDRVAVDALLPANADPHDFEPKPSDAAAVAEADLVFRSGGDLDGWLTDLIENAGGKADVTTMLDAVDHLEAEHAEGEEEHGHEHEGEDPHWWQDPRNAVKAVDAIEQALAKADPDGADAYRAAAEAYTQKIEGVDRAIAACIDRVPAEKRKLVTNHDAFGYFAHRYDIEVLGSIIPALSTSAQPSAGDVRKLVAGIKREGVTTVFPESALSTRLEQAVARDAGAKVGEPLYADTLGPGKDGTYLKALGHDATLITASFGAECELPAEAR